MTTTGGTGVGGGSTITAVAAVKFQLKQISSEECDGHTACRALGSTPSVLPT